MGKNWGWQKPGSLRWKQRYDTLRREGFVHEEAARIAEGIIGSLPMRRGRAARKKWLKEALKRGIKTKDQLEQAVDDMYDAYDWYDPYSQFYPE